MTTPIGQTLKKTPHLFDELVSAAMAAPSPDNNQPWLFEVADDRLIVYPDQTRALPSDSGDMFMSIAVGAACENIAIAASRYGLESAVRIFHQDETATGGGGAAAEITFGPGGKQDPLNTFIMSRCTSRKMYSRQPIATSVLQSVANSVDPFPDIRVDWITDRNSISELGAIIAQGDLIRLQHKPFHEELYRQLRFTVRETTESRDGLDVRTLELPPGAATMLRVLRNWATMNLVHRLGLGRLLAIPSAMAVRNSGAIGILSVTSPTAESFVQGGRALERLWLAATAEKLSVQPLGSLPVFFGHLQSNGGASLKAEHRQRAKTLERRFHRVVPGLSTRTILIAVRVGVAPQPTVRSLRRDPRETMLSEKSAQSKTEMAGDENN